MQAVIIAGGKGTRLRPFTHVLPKPLLPINDKPIIEINIKYLKDRGVNEVIVSDSLLYGKLLETIIGDGSRFGINIQYSYEHSPLLTAGGLGLLHDLLDNSFLVLNADTLHNLDINALADFHKLSNSDITIASHKIDYKVNLGVLKHSENKIEDYIEKPSFNYDASMGIYYMNKDIVCSYIHENHAIDFPTLIKKLISENKNIQLYRHSGLWIDLGTHDEYAKANESIDMFKEKYPEIPV